MAKPPNCSIVPLKIYGRRRSPSADRNRSDRKPINARNGANSSGKASIPATSAAGTFSSTIITRLSVPIIKTKAMPTET